VEGLKVERREKFEQRVKGKLRNNLIDTLLDSSGSTASLRVDLGGDILDQEQHCTLFYMLSRFVLPLGNVQVASRLSRSSLNSISGNARDGANNRPSGSNALSRIINNYGINPNEYVACSLFKISNCI
jgi:hypothetical protein